MRLLAVGKDRRGPEAEIFERYAARIRPTLTLVEFSEGIGSPVEIKRREGNALLAALARQDFVIALDQGGDMPDSAKLAKRLGGWMEAARRLNFVIGGAEGLDAAVLARADATLSLGRLTWPHLLVRPLLAEQLYRAQTILAGHPYHRAGRP
jgi:23S rRNA (pseudouridine1915-N3)-methyltransferase